MMTHHNGESCIARLMSHGEMTSLYHDDGDDDDYDDFSLWLRP